MMCRARPPGCGMEARGLACRRLANGGVAPWLGLAPASLPTFLEGCEGAGAGPRPHSLVAQGTA